MTRDLTAPKTWIGRGTPLGRMSDADEIAKAVLYLATADASNVTATQIVVDGDTINTPYDAPIYAAARGRS